MKILNKTKVKQVQKELISWENENFISFPWRVTNNKFHALIAEVMLQRTKAEQVIGVYEAFSCLLPDFNTAEKINTTYITNILKPLGLNWRIKNILALIREISKLGYVPLKYEELINLPGVGDYTASAFLTFHLNERMTIIDTNSVRLWSRVFNFEKKGELRRKKWFRDFVELITPIENHRVFNYGVLDVSRKYCKPNPSHEKCPLHNLCKFKILELCKHTKN